MRQIFVKRYPKYNLSMAFWQDNQILMENLALNGYRNLDIAYFLWYGKEVI